MGLTTKSGGQGLLETLTLHASPCSWIFVYPLIYLVTKNTGDRGHGFAYPEPCSQPLLGDSRQGPGADSCPQCRSIHYFPALCRAWHGQSCFNSYSSVIELSPHLLMLTLFNEVTWTTVTRLLWRPSFQLGQSQPCVLIPLSSGVP